ncbi:MAG: hypothetical protein JKY63_02995, partial [Rhodobiaceae bacterium]|nr:hypothetical protein [Rhodobiaceae bacterium]
SGTIVALLTNGGDGKGLSHTLMSRIFNGAAGIAPPSAPVVLAQPLADDPLTAYAGTYTKSSETAIVGVAGDALHCLIQPSANYGVIAPSAETKLQPVGRGRFISLSPGMSQPVNFNFLEPNAQGQTQYLYTGARVFPRRDG